MTRDSTIRSLIFLAVLAAAPSPAPAAEPLGRLFFTPDQRVSLDAARSKKTRVTTEEATEKPPAPPVPEVVTYGGVVRRSDGKSTVWLNDRAVDEKDARAGTAIVGRVRPDGSVTVQSAQTGRSVDLRVGQRAELLSGKVEEGYATRGVTNKPDASAAKPGADPGAGSTDKDKEETARRDRERRRDLDDAIRALEAASARPAPPPAETQAPPPQPPYPPSR